MKKTVTFEVAGFSDVIGRARQAFKGKRQESRISFASPELMSRTLTANRWTVIRAMLGAGPMSLRELARRLDRDVKAVHTDVHALLIGGVLRKTDDGQIEFPFDAVHVDFTVRAA